jgi:hypothetical protein
MIAKAIAVSIVSSKSATSADPTSSAAAPPGWVLVAPDRRPDAWYTYDPALSYDAVSTVARFEPHTSSRNGWTAFADRGVEVVGSLSALTKVSA